MSFDSKFNNLAIDLGTNWLHNLVSVIDEFLRYRSFLLQESAHQLSLVSASLLPVEFDVEGTKVERKINSR